MGMITVRRAAVVAALAALAGCNLGAPPAVYELGPPGSSPADLALGDVDEDGDLDVVAVFSAGYAVAANDGDGGFSTTNVSTSAVAGGRVALADVDGDGRLDMLHHNRGGAQRLDVRRGDGTGRFSTSRTILLSGDALVSEITVRDFDRDGDNDVIAGSSGGATLWRNAGGLTFGSPIGIDLGAAGNSLAVADLDGDGAEDLIAASSYSANPTISTALGDGAGGFAPATTVGTELVDVSGGMTIGAADLTGDGAPDVFGGVDGAPDLFVLRGDGAGGFDNTATFEGGTRTTRATAADVDGDGLNDVVTDDAVLFSDGAGLLVDKHDYVGGRRPVAADLGGDDRADVAAIAGLFGGNELRVLLNDLDGRTHEG